jgi:hypothetical protein
MQTYICLFYFTFHAHGRCVFISNAPFNSGVYAADETNSFVNWLECSKQEYTTQLQQSEVGESLFKVRRLHPVTRDVVSVSHTGNSIYMETFASIFRVEVAFSSETMAPGDFTTRHPTNYLTNYITKKKADCLFTQSQSSISCSQ